MSRERCLAFMTDLERRDVDALKDWFSEDAVLWMPPTSPVEGPRRILALFRTVFRMYTDLHWKVKELWPICENRVVYQTDSWGTIGADTPYKNHILTIIEFNADNRIKYLSDYFKDTAIFATGRKSIQ